VGGLIQRGYGRFASVLFWQGVLLYLEIDVLALADELIN
jgi:hypothetical protein